MSSLFRFSRIFLLGIEFCSNFFFLLIFFSVYRSLKVFSLILRLQSFALKSWPSLKIASLPTPGLLASFFLVSVISLEHSRCALLRDCPAGCFLPPCRSLASLQIPLPFVSPLPEPRSDYGGLFRHVPCASHILFNGGFFFSFCALWIFSSDLFYSSQILLCFGVQSLFSQRTKFFISLYVVISI